MVVASGALQGRRLIVADARNLGRDGSKGLLCEQLRFAFGSSTPTAAADADGATVAAGGPPGVSWGLRPIGAADVAPGDLIICDDGDGHFESWVPDPARVPAPAAPARRTAVVTYNASGSTVTQHATALATAKLGFSVAANADGDAVVTLTEVDHRAGHPDVSCAKLRAHGLGGWVLVSMRRGGAAVPLLGDRRANGAALIEAVRGWPSWTSGRQLSLTLAEHGPAVADAAAGGAAPGPTAAGPGGGAGIANCLSSMFCGLPAGHAGKCNTARSGSGN